MSDEFVLSESAAAEFMKYLSLSPARDGIANPSPYGAMTRIFNAIVIVSLAIGLVATNLIGAAKQNSARAAEKAVIAAFGDSLTHGYGLPEAQTFSVKLEAALREAGYPVRVINAGVSGDTSRGGLSRIGWTLSDKPDAIILELGANDGLRGLESADTYENLAGIIETAKSNDVRVLLTGMYAPPNLGQQYSKEFNAVFPRLAEKYETAFYPFFLKGVAADPALNQEDGIHPNGRGIDIIVRNILPHVVSVLPADVRAQGSLPDNAGKVSEEAKESSS